MAKKESTFFNMFLSLLVICVAAAGALGYVNGITEEPIAKAKKQNQVNALKMVLPPFEKIEEKEIPMNGFTLKGYYAYNGNTLVGVAIESYTESGFSGHIDVMVGFLPNGDIFNTRVLSHKETPGLGTKMTESPFKDQFPGKNPASFQLKVKKDGGDVDAITAATISSRAFCDATQRAYNAFSGNTDASSGATSEESNEKSTKNADASSGATAAEETSKKTDASSGATTEASPKQETTKETKPSSGETPKKAGKTKASKSTDANSGATTSY